VLTVRPLHFLYAFVVITLWGTSNFITKIAVVDFPPLMLLAIRCSIVALVMVPFVNVRTPLWKLYLKTGFFLYFLHWGFLYLALEQLDAGVATILVNFCVPVSVILAWLLLGERIQLQTVLGVFAAFVGVVLIYGAPNVIGKWIGFGFAMLSCCAWAVGSIQMRRLKEEPVRDFIFWAHLFAVPFLFATSFVLENQDWVFTSTADLWVKLAIIQTFYVLGPSIGAYSLFQYLIKRNQVQFVAPFLLLIPIVTVSQSAFFLGEPITWNLIVGGLLSTVGVGIITLQKKAA